jgi:DedD protein
MADLQETIDLRRRARRRLIGAIALVLALVIVPPWIMDLEPKPAATKLSVEIPTQDGGRIKPPVKPPAPEAVPKSAEPAKAPAPAKAPDAAKPAEAAPAKPAESTSAKPPAATATKPPPAAPATLDARTVAALGAPTTEPAPAAPRTGEDKAAPAPTSARTEATKKPAEVAAAPAGATESFVVPLGSYGSMDNVRQLQARLAKEGIQSYTEPVKTAAGERTRVRAGPYASREAAEQARERVKGLGIDAGNVIARQ